MPNHYPINTHLRVASYVKDYMQAAANTGDTKLIRAALCEVIRANRNMGWLADQLGLPTAKAAAVMFVPSRGNVSHHRVMDIAKALGITFVAKGKTVVVELDNKWEDSSFSG